MLLLLVSLLLSVLYLAAAAPEYSGMTKRFHFRLLHWFALAAVLLNGFFPAIWVLLTAFKSETELVRTPITWLLTQSRHWRISPGHSSNSRCCISSVTVWRSHCCPRRLRLRLQRPPPTRLPAFLCADGAFGLPSWWERRCGPPYAHLHLLFEISVRGLGLLNTWLALVLPNAVQSLPVCTLVLVSFFHTIPPELEQAAMIDGCSRFGSLIRIVLPLSAPGIFTAAILAFVNSWDEFLLALTLNSAPATRTLPVGLMLYR